jgi:hypothetical protein
VFVGSARGGLLYIVLFGFVILYVYIICGEYGTCYLQAFCPAGCEKAYSDAQDLPEDGKSGTGTGRAEDEGAEVKQV